jgi:hypothetical protein
MNDETLFIRESKWISKEEVMKWLPATQPISNDAIDPPPTRLDCDIIDPPKIPFDLDAKIFYHTDEEGNPVEGPYSYMDQVKILKDIAGVNEELLGKVE